MQDGVSWWVRVGVGYAKEMRMAIETHEEITMVNKIAMNRKIMNMGHPTRLIMQEEYDDEKVLKIEGPTETSMRAINGNIMFY